MTSAKEDAKLHQRVQEWQTQMEPKLEAEVKKNSN
jgi:hypothetical protein